MGQTKGKAGVQREREFLRAQLGDDNLRLLGNFVRLLAEGEPVAVDRLAKEADYPTEQLGADLAGNPSIEWDDEGRIEGLGLTLRKTPHSVTFPSTHPKQSSPRCAPRRR